MIPDNLVPGDIFTSGVKKVQYTGTVDGDIYVGMRAEGDEGDDLTEVLDYRIYRVEYDDGWKFAGWVDGDNWKQTKNLFENWTKIADNATPDSWHRYMVQIRMDEGAGNTYEDNLTFRYYPYILCNSR